MRRANSARHFIRIGVLDQVARRARFERRVHTVLVAEGRQRDDLDAVERCANPSRRRDPVERRHLEVHQNDVGQAAVGGQPLQQRERLGSALRVTHDLDVRLRVQEGLQPAPDDGMIVDEDDANRGTAVTVHRRSPTRREA